MNTTDCYISPKAKLGKNVSVGKGAIIYDNVEIEDNCFIGPYAIIGEPTMSFYKDQQHENKKTVIGANSIIRAHTVIYEDVTVGEYFQTGHYAMIREETAIGEYSSLGSYSEVFGKLRIGSYVRIHSKVGIGEGTIIEDYVWVFPYTFITNDKYPPHNRMQPCRLAEFSIVLSNATIMPGVTIGRNSLVGAGSVVTKDVDDERIVIGNPARDVKSIRDIKDSDGNPVYPWREHLKDYRGYPWQEK